MEVGSATNEPRRNVGRMPCHHVGLLDHRFLCCACGASVRQRLMQAGRICRLIVSPPSPGVNTVKPAGSQWTHGQRFKQMHQRASGLRPNEPVCMDEKLPGRRQSAHKTWMAGPAPIAPIRRPAASPANMASSYDARAYPYQEIFSPNHTTSTAASGMCKLKMHAWPSPLVPCIGIPRERLFPQP